jgi:hypothetical protein
MEKQNRKCGECAEFFRCVNESGEILQRQARGEELKHVSNAPACEDFKEAVTMNGHCLLIREREGKRNFVEVVRDLCHEATRSGESSPLIVAALELAEEYEKLDRLTDQCAKAIEEISAMIEVTR